MERRLRNRAVNLAILMILVVGMFATLPIMARAADTGSQTATQEMKQEAGAAGQEIQQETGEAAQEMEAGIEEAAGEAKDLTAEVEQQIDDAVQSFKATMEEEQRIPRDAIANAKAVAIFPEVTKAALGVGGRYGEGVMMINQDGSWTGPLLINLYGASVGAQLGAEQADVFMVFNTDQSLEALKDGELTFGAEASIAAGDWGEKEGASTEADVIAYKRTSGLFAGLSLSGAVLQVDDERNEGFYNQEGQERAYYGSEEAISGQNVPHSEAGDELADLFKNYE